MVTESTILLNDLNSDCLIEIFSYCDFHGLIALAESCILFEQIINEHFFSRFTKFEYTITEDTDLVSLERRAKVTRNRVDHIVLNIFARKQDSRKLTALLKTFSAFIGPNIRFLELNATLVSWTILNALKPILDNIESLELRNVLEDETIVLDEHCPKLKHLAIYEKNVFEENFGLFPELESIEFPKAYILLPYRDFFVENARIKRIKTIASMDAIIQSSVISNLEEIELIGSVSELLETLERLDELRSLTSLSLLIRQSDYDNKKIVDLFQLINVPLVKLKVHNYMFLWSENSKITEMIPRNNLLGEMHFEKCVFTESGFLKAIESAPNLQFLHIHSCEISFSESFVRKISDKRTEMNVEFPLTIMTNSSRAPISNITAIKFLNCCSAQRNNFVSCKCICCRANSGNFFENRYPHEFFSEFSLDMVEKKVSKLQALWSSLKQIF